MKFSSAFICVFVFLWYINGFAQTDTLNISWSPNALSDSVISYKLYRHFCNKLSDTADVNSYQEIANIYTTKYTDTDRNSINPGMLISYRVKAFNSSGSSDFSNEAHAGIPHINWTSVSVQNDTIINLKDSEAVTDPDDTNLDNIKFQISQVSPGIEVILLPPDSTKLQIFIQDSSNGSFYLSAKDTAGFYDLKRISLSPPTPTQSLVVYPNPVYYNRGVSTVMFDGLPEDTEEIIIVTINNEPVAKYTFKGQINRRWQWNLRTDNNNQVVSGLYLYVIKGKGNRNLASGKIAIIR